MSALKGKLFAVGGRNATGEIGELLLILVLLLLQALLFVKVS